VPVAVVVGANADRRKFGNKAVRAHLAAGYDVYPVHPTESVVEGRPVVRSVADVPAGHLDVVTLYLPPAVGRTVLPALAGRSVGTLILNPGADSPEVLAEARRLGLPAVRGCSIIAAGYSPADFPDA
jgi:hypothetical protein